MADRVIEELDKAECLRLISPGGVGRIGYTSRGGIEVLPVNYTIIDGAIVFRTAEHGPLDEDLRTGIEGAEYRVAFEIDEVDEAGRLGWSVLVNGPIHHVSEDERAAVSASGHVDPWVPEGRQLYIRITPSRITGRRIVAAQPTPHG
jgi:nitroimidazol reductase NimA-like FMN-containing flavoprotein (pyridoxamine 5'-phosphate oxidase superfamily)